MMHKIIQNEHQFNEDKCNICKVSLSLSGPSQLYSTADLKRRVCTVLSIDQQCPGHVDAPISIAETVENGHQSGPVHRKNRSAAEKNARTPEGRL